MSCLLQGFTIIREICLYVPYMHSYIAKQFQVNNWKASMFPIFLKMVFMRKSVKSVYLVKATLSIFYG